VARRDACVISWFILTIFIQISLVEAFVTRASTLSCKRGFALHANLNSNVRQPRNKLFMRSTDPIAAGEDMMASVEDKNGKAIGVGAVIRVAVDNLKAYQVPAKGQGYFNDGKEFVLGPGDGERRTKNLKLPVGLRGVVTKVYDIDHISANHPIVVKFMPGNNVDEGYDPPVAFIMHFSPEEIECA
jgi:hypothetical protein